MRKSYVTLDCGEHECPQCSNSLTTAVFYTARPAGQKIEKALNQEALKTTTTTTTTTTYTDIVRQTGKLCLPCARKEARRLKVNGLKYTLAAVAVLVYTFGPFPKNTWLLLLTLGIALVLGFLGLFVLIKDGQRLSALIKYQDNDALSAIVVELISFSKLPEGHTALSTAQYQRMQKSRE